MQHFTDITSVKRVVLFHANCADGFTAAWAAWKKYGDAAAYVPVYYGEDPPDVTGKDVLIVDFSYPRDTILRMSHDAASLTLFDHHATAKCELDPLVKQLQSIGTKEEAAMAYDAAAREAFGEFARLNFPDPPNLVAANARITFDMNRSGASITWDELHGGTRPRIVSYVEDRDLWRFKLQQSKEITARIQVQEQTFEAWDELANRIENHFNEVVAEGSAVLLGIAAYVQHIAKNAQIIHFAGHDIPVVNAPQMHVSDLLDVLAQNQAFALAWWQRQDGIYQYSLRSRGGFDVSAIAKGMGGGWHAAAAGFQSQMPLSDLLLSDRALALEGQR